jgi:hypothetical protein
VGEYSLEVQDDKIEIYIVDQTGAEIEGGTFPLEQFRLRVKEYYNDYF